MASGLPGPPSVRPLKRKREPSTLEKTNAKKLSRKDNGIDRSASDLKDGMMRNLECPVCFEIMKSPIFQCSSGHSFCSNCIKNFPSCPVCQISVINPVRNFSLEKMSELLETFSQKNKHDSQGILCGNEDSHGNRHLIREYDCPIAEDMDTTCSWKGRRTLILRHVQEVHPGSIQNVEERSYEYKHLCEQDYVHSVDILHLKDNLFVSYYHYEKWKGKIWRAVRYIGPNENASKFVYKIKLVTPDQSRKVMYTRKVHTEDEDIETMLENDDCFTITQKQIGNFKVPNLEHVLYNEFTIICV